MKHQDMIDDAIERALVRDSKKLPAFSTSPNSALTAKLAISIASKGMLGTVGAKLALFGGTALLAGAALYYSASQNQVASTQTIQATHPQTTAIVMDTSKRDSAKPTQTVATARTKVSAKIKTAHSEPIQSKAVAIVPKDSTQIPRIQNPNYQPPLK